jgi:hypothetical protein
MEQYNASEPRFQITGKILIGMFNLRFSFVGMSFKSMHIELETDPCWLEFGIDSNLR